MNKATVRVLQVFSLFSQKTLWGVSEVAREMACTKHSAFQALDTLALEGYLVRDESGQRYQLSHLALSFVGEGESLDVRSLCQPYLVRLHKLTGESTFLSIIVGRYNVCIESIQTHGRTVGYSPLSAPIPLHAGAGSRLLLSCLTDDEIRHYLRIASPLEKITPATITDPDELWREIELVRSRGYARGYEDYSIGANFLSFPVLGAAGRPLGAITIGGPTDRFTHEAADEMIPTIQTVLDELNRHSRMFPVIPMVRF